MSWDPNNNNFGGDFSSGADQASNSNGGGYGAPSERRGPSYAGSASAPADRPERSYNWASNRARYEYNENAVDADGMAPRDEKLETELFGVDPNEQQTPLDFSKYESIPIKIERGQAPAPIKHFDQADLHPVMKENIRLARYAHPTPVQTYSIPIVTSGNDLMACAQTGSGKTAAFLIPILSGLFGRAKELSQPRPAPYEYRSFKAEPLVLILAPTRELCSQIFDECRKFTYRSSLRPCAVYGGADSLSQIRQLERGCDILAAAPGRLMDFIERGKIGLGRVRYLVLDEADRMLDMGFESVIRAIVEKRGLNPERQTLMYSATFPRAIRKLARDFLRPNYVFLKVGRVGGTTSSITQKVMFVEEQDKRETLRNLLNSQPPSRTLIFVETKRSADSLDQYLFERDFPSTSIHGDRTQMEREDALLAFKNGQCPILVATAVAARGIDIRNVMHVVNYDMPDNMDEYIHRIGRTARVGRSGLATSFYNDRSSALAPELTKLLKECNQEIPDFLEPYVTNEIVWEEDQDEEDVPLPSYAGQEYVPQDRNPPPGSAPAPAETGDSGAWGGDTSGWGGDTSGWGADSGAGGDTTTGWENSGDYGSGGGSKYAARDGDWNCPGCGVSNYARRTECFKCHDPNPNGGSSGGGYGNSTPRDGDWNCPECNISNYARRTECFKCGAANPNPSASGERRGPPPRRDGDWDCACGAVNFARRTDCFRCHAPKADGDSAGGYGDSSYGADNYGSYDAGNNDTSGAADGGNWDPNAASAGWGQPESAAPAVSSGGWGEPEPAASSGGWGQPEPAAPAASSGGWGQPESAAPAAAAPAASSGGWGQPEPAAPAASSGGWGQPEPAAPAASSGGWGQPEPAKPAASSGGWGQPEPAAPAATSGGWGQPEPAKPAPPAGGWGQPAPSAPAAKPSPPPKDEGITSDFNKLNVDDAPQSNGWGAAPAAPSADGWGDVPAQPSGFGWS